MDEVKQNWNTTTMLLIDAEHLSDMKEALAYYTAGEWSIQGNSRRFNTMTGRWEAQLLHDPDKQYEAKAAQCVHIAVDEAKDIAGKLLAAATEIERLRDQAHYATGTAELAIKHRDEAEAENEKLRAALERIANETAATWVQDVAKEALSTKVSEAGEVTDKPFRWPCTCYRSVTEKRKECDSGDECPSLHAVARRFGRVTEKNSD